MTQTVSWQSPRDTVQSCRRLVSRVFGSVLLLALMPTQLHTQIATKQRDCGNGEGARIHGVDVQYSEGRRVSLCAQQLTAAGTMAAGTVTAASVDVHGQVVAVLPPTADDINHTWCVQYDYGDRQDLKGKHAIWWIRDVGDGVSGLDQILIMQFDVGTWSCAKPPRFVSGASLDPTACIHTDDFVKGNPHSVGVGCFVAIEEGNFVGRVP